MELHEAIELIKPALTPPQPGKVWADLGCGDGLFTKALATLLESGSVIHAVDRSNQILEPTFHGNHIVFHQLDFTDGAFPFAEVDGFLLANSLHFIKERESLLASLKAHLRENGGLIIIEYEMNKANPWVPYPIPYRLLKSVLSELGFNKIDLIGERASLYGGRKMYSCAASVH